MIIDIPGYKKLQITTLLLDYNGTIAEDGICLLYTSPSPRD